MAPNPPPKVPGSLLTGSAGDLKRDQLATYARAMLEHGGRRVRFRVGPPRVGFEFDTVFRPEDAHRVLAADAAAYDKEVPGIDELRRLVGNGLLFSDGDRWRRDRRTVAPLLAKGRIMGQVDQMAAAAADLSASWSDAPGTQVDVAAMAMSYTLDVLGRSIFGADVESTAPVLRATVPVINGYAAKRLLSPVRLPPWLPFPANRRANMARRALRDMVDGLVAKRRAGPLDGDDLLSLLLTVRDPETGNALDDVTVRDQALIFLAGGHETTATAMALTVYLLGRHADVQQQVRDEVAAVVGDRPVAAGDLPRLVLTAHAIDEAMRLYPPAHTLLRHAHQPTTLDGQEVPDGHLVAVSVWGVHHNPDVWPDPDRYDPTRFDAARGRYDHLPFGGGPRGCIGQFLATAELVVGVATLVRAWRFKSPPQEPALEVGLTLRPHGELLVGVTPFR